MLFVKVNKIEWNDVHDEHEKARPYKTCHKSFWNNQ